MTKYQGEERDRNVFKSEGSKKNSAKKDGSKKLNMKLPVLPDWPIEKIRNLTNDQIKNLELNAQQKNFPNIVRNCREILAERHQPKVERRKP